MLIDRSVREEFLDFAAPHLVWMPLVVKQDIAPPPVDVSFFRPNGIVLQPDFLADRVKEFLGACLHLFPPSLLA